MWQQKKVEETELFQREMEEVKTKCFSTGREGGHFFAILSVLIIVSSTFKF